MDIETTGLSRTSEILQVAAKCSGEDGAVFSAYSFPMREIPAKVTEITGLKMLGKKLVLRGENVSATSLLNACKAFVEFLQDQKKPLVLVGHNSYSFDFPHMYRVLLDFDLLHQFCKVVCGLSDTLTIFKSVPIINEHNPSLSLPILAEKYLPNWTGEEAHEALSDCMTLETICVVFQCTETLISSRKPIEEFLANQEHLHKQYLLEKELGPGFSPLKAVISEAMVKRLAHNGLSMRILKDTYRLGRDESIRILLEEANEFGKPRITKDQRIIGAVNRFLNEETSVNRSISDEMGKLTVS